MTELLESLTECERQKFEEEQEAARRVREAEARVTAQTQHLAEARRANEQELRQLQAQCEKRLRDSAYQARREVRLAEQRNAEAQGLAQDAEELQKRTDTHVKNLEKKVS